jgi:lipid II:glycine glycyltransferase (peptidoglycan interpeptide bridge formation enzyme)
MIATLQATPDRNKLLEALQALRKDKVKNASHTTIQAAQFDCSQVFEYFLQNGEKRNRTKQTSRIECRRLFDWLDRQRLHIFQLQRPDVNRYKADLL